MKRLKQEYDERKQGEMFQALRGFLPGSGVGPSRSEIASQKGMRAGAVDVAVHRVRRRFGDLLREEVARTVSSPGEIQEEIRYLMSVLGC